MMAEGACALVGPAILTYELGGDVALLVLGSSCIIVICNCLLRKLCVLIVCCLLFVAYCLFQINVLICWYK